MSTRPAFLALALTLGAVAGPVFSQDLRLVSQGREMLELKARHVLQRYNVAADPTMLSLPQLNRIIRAADGDHRQPRATIRAAINRY